MSEDVKNKENKKDNKIGLKLYVFIFLIVYVILQIGFTGLTVKLSHHHSFLRFQQTDTCDTVKVLLH